MSDRLLQPELDTSTAPIPDEIAKALRELDADWLTRVLLLQKATEQRARILSVEIARLVAKLRLQRDESEIGR